MQIYALSSSSDPFAQAPTCKLIPHFLFGLPLHEWLPSLFLPSGLCGDDSPAPPNDLSPSALQEFLIGHAPNFNDGLYSKGWFLIPQLHFLNMAEFVFVIFIFYFFCALAGLFVSIFKKN